MNLTNELLWGIIESLDWSGRCRERRVYNKIKLEFMSAYNKDMAVAVRDFLNCRVRELYAAYDEYVKSHRRESVGFFGGDDSFDDMMNHVVGSGREVFEGVLEDMTMLNYVRYVESFSYCLPYIWEDGTSDYDLLDMEKHKENARRAMTDLAENIAHPDSDITNDEAVVAAEIFMRLSHMLAGDVEKAVADFEFDKDYRRLSDVHTYSANILSDASSAMPFLK